MKMQFTFPPVFRTLFLWAGILVVTLFMFSPTVSSVSAAEKGWVDIRASVPAGFDEDIIVCFHSQTDGEDYAVRLSKENNNYKTVFDFPAGFYEYTCAFLENADFRYNTTLANDAITFEVSPNNATPLVYLKTTYNEEYADGASLPDPTEETAEAAETTEITEPEEPVVVPSAGVQAPSVSVQPVPQATTPAGQEPPAATTPAAPFTIETSIPSAGESTPPSEGGNVSGGYTVIEATDIATEPQVQLSEKDQGSHRDTAALRDEKKEDAEETEEPVQEPAEEEEKGGFTWWQKLLYFLLAAGIFTLIIFAIAYLYRRHLEKN